MCRPPPTLAADVALVARVLARLGLVHAFGHVPARVPVASPPPGGAVDTARSPLRPHAPLRALAAEGALAAVEACCSPRRRWGAGRGEVLVLTRPGGCLAGARSTGRWRRRCTWPSTPPGPVGAICRLHGPAVVASGPPAPPAAAARVRGMVEPVAFWDDPDLVAAEPAAGRAAAALGAPRRCCWPATAA